ncbi:MAG: hypothetical protein ACXABY_19435 [Candidatus Thorarchaeota archaeon]
MPKKIKPRKTKKDRKGEFVKKLEARKKRIEDAIAANSQELAKSRQRTIQIEDLMLRQQGGLDEINVLLTPPEKPDGAETKT